MNPEAMSVYLYAADAARGGCAEFRVEETENTHMGQRIVDHGAKVHAKQVRLNDSLSLINLL
jgi:hypothetical protein